MQLTGCATTLGFGPRFLHSTGQIHKGGPANCLIIQITMDYSSHDLKIPASNFHLATLQAAQAQGDLEALQIRNRKILAFT
jgi:transaldolase/glucose-6-phosphate isomerase